MSAKKSIRQLLEAKEFIWAPCIYDCVSARVVEKCGYNACLISSCELEFAMNGIPAGLYNWEEYIWLRSVLPVLRHFRSSWMEKTAVEHHWRSIATASAWRRPEPWQSRLRIHFPVR